MMAFSTEPSLDCKPTSYSMLLKSFGDQQTDQKQKLEEILARLEEERFKIDAFKRELPLCMQLLTNAMEASRQQLQSYLANQAPRPVLEEFIPLKHSTSECSDHKVFNMSDKASWMTSAQLWSQTSEENKEQSTIISSPKETEIGLNVSPKLALDSKQWNGGAFIPFSKERDLNSNRVGPDLALNLVDNDMMEDKRCLEINDNEVRGNFAKLGRTENDQGENIRTDPQTTVATVINTANNTTTHTQRKARRCWSPDLHRRFVNALQMLGGSQVATPKQIRELMKVDGLTNDEVKSHLQKYRLHTRRPSPSPQATGGPAPQLVVLGGIWVQPEYTAAHGGAVPPVYSAHSTAHAPPYYSAQPMPHQFYSAPPPSEAVQHQLHLHHQLHMYQDSPLNDSFPDSEVRGVGDSSESIEDGKSESGSWKAGESGSENSCGGERKGLASLRVKGE